ncbi:MAG: hypothetical protein KIT56_05605 [Gammaproteobacteria bacterium]|nr:hypothetical protein [Gammaproteobacteria bacterium]MCW5583347.1 hypothetical protein [Gammaproteobacteria bacterium]
MKVRQPSPLENLLVKDPGQNNILHRLDITDYVRLSRTCYSMSEFFKAPLSIKTIKLPYYINQEPNDNKVKFFLRNNLNLLNVVFKKVIGKTQTFLNVTPLQLAHGARDDVMCNTLKPFFVQLHGSEKAGIDEMQRQISEMKDDHKPFDFNPIIQAISNESFNNGLDAKTSKLILSKATLAAIEQFRKDFDATQPKIIDKGMHFRWETLEELFENYVHAAAQWNHNYNKCALFEDAAIAWVLGYVPENGAQSFNQGLYYLQKDNPEPFKRAATTRNGCNFHVALKYESVDFLLSGSCIDIVYGDRCDRIGWPPMAYDSVQDLCRAKTSSLKTYTASSEESVSVVYNAMR